MFARELAATHPRRTAIVMASTGEAVTYGEYERRCNRLAHHMRSLGLRRGDHVAFFMENNPRIVECQGAAERIGLYYTLVNSHFSPEEAAYVINDCTAKLVVTSAARAEAAATLPAACPGVQEWLVVDAPLDGYRRFEDVVEDQPTHPVADESAGRPMLYSSGTTGRPKGIIRPLPAAGPGEHDAVLPLKYLQAAWKLHPAMTYLSPAPLYHASPQANLAAALRLGATSVIMERFDAETFLRLIGQYGVTHTQVVPTMFVRLLKLPEEKRRAADVSTLESVVHAAAPCPPAVKRQIIEWFGPIVTEYLGTSEGVGSTLCSSEDWLAHPGTVGRAQNCEVHILDRDGNPCPPGVAGEIWFSGDAGFEYFNDPVKTAEVKDATGTRVSTGDIGYLDEDGFLFLTDRKSHTIISGGVNIYPREIEDLLVTHPAVVDAAVIGVPDEDLGEVVKAVVEVAQPGQPDALAAELSDFCRAHLARYKCPRSFDVVDALPRLPNGKLYKRVLRERYTGDRDPQSGRAQA